MRTLTEAKSAFATISKLDQGQTMRLLKIEKAFQSLAEDIFDLVPENADRTAGLRKMLEAKMTFSQAVSHGAATIEDKKSAKEKN